MPVRSSEIRFGILNFMLYSGYLTITMEIISNKFLKFPLVLLAILGFIFSLLCAFNHPEASAHSALPEVGTFIIQGSETCCGTNLTKQHKPLNEEFLAVPKETNHDPLNFRILGLLAVSMIFKQHSLDNLGRRLAILQKLYIRNNPLISLFNHLILAFLHGILNPKKYIRAFSS